MSKQITLYELIEQVRDELLTPRQVSSSEDMYPFLFVDEVELEVSVSVSASGSGSGKLTIYVLEVGGEGQRTQEKGHIVRVKLSPLISKEEIRQQLQKEEKLWAGIERIAKRALKEDVQQAGPQE